MTDANPRPQNPAPRPGRRRLLIKVEPQDISRELPPLKERVVAAVRTDWPGYLASLAFHTLLLLLLWFILAPRAFLFLGGRQGDAMELQLSDLDDATGAKARPKQPRKPIFEANVKSIPQPDPDPDNPGKKSGKPAGKGPLPQPVQPVNVNALFKNRTPDERTRVMKELDPQQKIRTAIRGGLNWLQWQQKSDGHWVLYGKQAGYPDAGEYASLNTDTGATALAMLAFLGDGHTHQKGGPYQKTVAKGIKWLLGIQRPNGDFHDVVEEGRQASFYAHSQATIVLCEAYAMTGDKSLREPAERGVKYLLQSQNPQKGGWKYRPQLPVSKGDLSVTGWALMALHSARSAGLEIPPQAFELGATFLDSVQEQNGSLYKYESVKWQPTPTMTAEGLLCRQFLGWPKDYAPLRKGIDYLKRPMNEPRWLPGNRPHVYYWYYAGHVFHNMGGPEWKQWYDKTAIMIVDRRSRVPGRKKNLAGSWDPKERGKYEYFGYGKFGGRLYMTAMCLLVLELPIRHRPIYAE